MVCLTANLETCLRAFVFYLFPIVAAQYALASHLEYALYLSSRVQQSSSHCYRMMLNVRISDERRFHPTNRAGVKIPCALLGILSTHNSICVYPNKGNT